MQTAGHSGRLSILQAAAIDDVEMGPSALRMLVALGTYADGEGWCWPKQRVLADRLGLTQQAVSKAIRDVVKLGYVEAHDQFDPVSGARLSSRYRIVLDFVLPPERRRTPQPDVVGSQLQVVTPTTPEVVGPTTPEVVAPTTPEVVATEEERPRKNDPKERPIPDPADSAELELFGYYRAKIQPRVRVNAPEKIRARLKTFTVAELKQAIDNFSADWWWMQHNATQGVEWFFRSDRQCERFLHLTPRPAPDREPQTGTAAGRNGTHGASAPGQTTDEDLAARMAQRERMTPTERLAAARQARGLT